jgi:FkbM family methyltransferase
MTTWNALLDIFENKEATLVQIGANDGISHGDESLYDTIKRNSAWKKILIEPVEENMDLLRTNYKDVENVFFEQVAIGNEESVETMYINTVGNDGGLFGALSTFKKDITERFFGHVTFKREDIEVKPFSYILDKYNINEIDILQSDTEGYDGVILNQILDLGIFPKILKVETGFMSGEETTRILEILRDQGYIILQFSPDLIAGR